jgi:hypothetical protein
MPGMERSALLRRRGSESAAVHSLPRCPASRYCCIFCRQKDAAPGIIRVFNVLVAVNQRPACLECRTATFSVRLSAELRATLPALFCSQKIADNSDGVADLEAKLENSAVTLLLLLFPTPPPPAFAAEIESTERVQRFCQIPSSLSVDLGSLECDLGRLSVPHLTTFYREISMSTWEYSVNRGRTWIRAV